jgi:hypothetical protein
MAEKVVIYEYDFTKDKDVATGSIVWDGKKMSAIGTVAQKILDELTESGIMDPSLGKKKRFYPKDGTKFLPLLKFRYDNPYLRASDVMTV